MPRVRVATFNVENLFARFKFKEGIDPDKAVKDGSNAEETAFRHPHSRRRSGSRERRSSRRPRT